MTRAPLPAYLRAPTDPYAAVLRAWALDLMERAALYPEEARFGLAGRRGRCWPQGKVCR